MSWRGSSSRSMAVRALRVPRRSRSMLESEELVAAMREEGASAVIARFGRDRTYRMCQAIYLAGIVGFGIVFVAMLAIAPF